nr:MAG TPA_asm: hypothetical protein [Caudoviricetes sp.]
MVRDLCGTSPGLASWFDAHWQLYIAVLAYI